MEICSFFRFKKNRTSVLLGAGAALELYNNKNIFPSVGYITKEIVKNKPQKYIFNNSNHRCENIDLIERIFLRLCRNHNPVLNPFYSGKSCYTNIHFEILFHILEELTSFDRIWKKIPNKDKVVQFAHLVEPNFCYDNNEISICIKHVIKTVYEIIGTYDNHFFHLSNDWYKSFWLKKKNNWDVFTLNYDTTVEQSLTSYEDGYQNIKDEQKFQKFSIAKLLKNNYKLSTINHLHGCVLYGHERYTDINHDIYDYNSHDLYKYNDYQTAFKNWQGISTSTNTAMDGTDIVQGPIITGLNKTDKITCLPYSSYRYNLDKCLLENDSLLIVGYSFGDKYINSAIERLNQFHNNKRVVVIDFWDVCSYVSDLEGKDKSEVTDDDITHRELYHMVGYDHNKGEMLRFMCKISQTSTFEQLFEDMNSISSEKPMISKNNQLMLCIGGFKKTVENYGKEVLDFLNFK